MNMKIGGKDKKNFKPVICCKALPCGRQVPAIFSAGSVNFQKSHGLIYCSFSHDKCRDN
jgi:hypothetical protein